MRRARSSWSSWSSWLWGAVVVSIVLMQWLAFVHRIAHNPSVAVGHSIETHGEHTHEPSSWVDGLFAHEDGDITCHLQDALTAMDGGCMYKTAVHIAPPAILLVAFSQIMSIARAAALFEARGPPARS